MDSYVRGLRSGISRRAFLKQAGGAFFAADMVQKDENHLFQRPTASDTTEPGTWNFFASACRECPAGCGILLWHRDGRVTKAEGISNHVIGHGALCPRGQSSVQGLYDPDRIRFPKLQVPVGNETVGQKEWQMALEEVGNWLNGTSDVHDRPAKLAVMSGLQTGAMDEVLRAFVGSRDSNRLIYYEPFNYEPLRKAHQAVFGNPVIPSYKLDSCDYIVSFGADFLESWISPVQFAHDFAQMHTYKDGKLGRMDYVGPRLSMTAANADNFMHVPCGADFDIAMAMLDAIVSNGWAKNDISPAKSIISNYTVSGGKLPAGVTAEQVRSMAEAFAKADASVALACPVGSNSPVAYDTAVAAALLNYACGRIGQTVDFSRPHALSKTATQDEMAQFLASLTSDDVLVIVDANPAYSLPGAADQMKKAGLVVYLGTLEDETAKLAHWVLPVHSPLESWGDYEPVGGVHDLMQPTMAPVLDTMQVGDTILAIAQIARKPLSRSGADTPSPDFATWVKERWAELHKTVAPDKPFDAFWREALQSGGAAQTPARVETQLSPGAAEVKLAASAISAPEPGKADLCLWSPIMLFDGRTANRGWMQEIPEPTSHIVWTNYIDIHPKHAAALDVKDNEIVEASANGVSIKLPLRVTEDVVEGCIAIGFGQGHTAMGRTAEGRGANAFLLAGAPRVDLRKTGQSELLVYETTTQDQHGREILQSVSLKDLRKMKPGEGEHLILPLPEGYDRTRDMYRPRLYKEHRWAMAVDLHRCIGCGACAAACYAENNLPVVGRAWVEKRRQLAWMRVVPYRDQDNPKKMDFIPMLCQHCDCAPCEPVCPVYASVHNEEGLNAQIFNRCIGTRYCSNNCPYKVRRFNWINVEFADLLKLQLNPEVTVRVRGVMEKCTFCIQRIRYAEWRAKKEDRPVRDGEIVPACAQTCPVRAIVFGDLLDENAEVTKLTRQDPRRYHVLEELNTKPAVTYLRTIRTEET